MIERLMRLVFELLVLLMVLSFALGLAGGLLREGCAVVGTTTQHVIPHLLADVIVTLATGLFCIGLAVRLQRALSGRNGRAGRDRAAQERQVRLAVRRPAEDVPVIPLDAGPPPDPDPAIDLEEN